MHSKLVALAALLLSSTAVLAQSQPKQLWFNSFEWGTSAFGPAAAGDSVYAVDFNISIHRVNLQTGRTVWVGPQLAQLCAVPSPATNLIVGTSTIGAVCQSSFVVSDMKSGKVLWSINSEVLGTTVAFTGSAYVLPGTSDLGDTIMVLERSGLLIARLPQAEQIVVAANTIAITASSNSSLVGYDSATGKALWCYNLPVTSVAVNAAQLVVFTDNGLALLDPSTGVAIWTADGVQGTFGVGYADIIVAVLSSGTGLQALGASDGTTLWTMNSINQNVSGISPNVVVADGILGVMTTVTNSHNAVAAIDVSSGSVLGFGVVPTTTSNPPLLYAAGQQLVVPNLESLDFFSSAIQLNSVVRLEGVTAGTTQGTTLFAVNPLGLAAIRL